MTAESGLATKLALVGASIVVFFFWPYLLVSLPFLLVGAFYSLKNNQADPETSRRFFDGFRFGGHRGSPHSFPENSHSGFVQSTLSSCPTYVHINVLGELVTAQLEGADLIEFDLALTKCGTAVLLHDDDLDRTTDLAGPVRDKTLEELSSAFLASKFNRHLLSPATGDIPHECVPTLEATIKWSVENKIKMLFDVKDYSDEMVSIIVRLFKQYDLYDKACVCSFYPWVVYKVKRASPQVVTGITWRQKFISHEDLEGCKPRYSGIKQLTAQLLSRIYLSVLMNGILAKFVGADLILTNEKDINRTFVADQLSKGLRVVAWTVNDVVQMQWLHSLGVPILTDFPFYAAHLGRLDSFVKNNYNNLSAN